MSILRKEDGTAAQCRWTFGGLHAVFQTEVLLDGVPRQSGGKAGSEAVSIALARAEVKAGILRVVRIKDELASTPQRPQRMEQLPGELADALRQLSQSFALENAQGTFEFFAEVNCYELPPWELSGGGIEDGARFYCTPTTVESRPSAKSWHKNPTLGDVVAEERARQPAKSAPWPTPCATDHKGSGKNGSDRDRLDYAVERGATKSHLYPTVGTQTMGGCSGSFAKLKELEEIGRLTPEERRAMSSHLTGGKDPDTANCGMLNPDWVEWLMGWPIWWTDADFRNADGGQCVMPWLDLADDPAEWPTPLMQRITTRKTHRVHRIETLGNGQVPLCAAVAFIYGREILRVALRLAA